MISDTLHRKRLQISAYYTNKNRASRMTEGSVCIHLFKCCYLLRNYFLLEITTAAPASATPASARPAVAPVAAVLSEAAAEDVAAVLFYI